MKNALRVISQPSYGPKLELHFGLFRLVSAFLQFKQIEQRSPRTIRDYRDELEAFIRLLQARGHSLRPEDVGPWDVLAYLGSLQERGNAPSTVGRAYGNLRTFFNWLVTQGVVEDAPTRRVKPPREPKKTKPVLTDDQIAHLFSLCPQNTFRGARRYAMYAILLTTGMRLQELAGLKCGDLNIPEGIIHISWETAKGAKSRDVVWYNWVQRAVWEYLQHREDDEEALWVDAKGRPMKYGGVQADLYRMFERAGFKGRLKDAVHIFRRTWAFTSLRKGIPAKMVQLAGGWASLQMLDGYVRALDSEHALEHFRRVSLFE